MTKLSDHTNNVLKQIGRDTDLGILVIKGGSSVALGDWKIKTESDGSLKHSRYEKTRKEGNKWVDYDVKGKSSILTDIGLDAPGRRIFFIDADGHHHSLIAPAYTDRTGVSVGNVDGINALLSNGRVLSVHKTTDAAVKFPYYNDGSDTQVCSDCSFTLPVSTDNRMVAKSFFFANNPTAGTKFQFILEDTLGNIVYESVSDHDFENGGGQVVIDGENTYTMSPEFRLPLGFQLKTIMRFSNPTTIQGETTTEFKFKFTIEASLVHVHPVLELPDWAEINLRNSGVFTRGDWVFEDGRIYSCIAAGPQTGTFAENYIADKWVKLESTEADPYPKIGGHLDVNSNHILNTVADAGTTNTITNEAWVTGVAGTSNATVSGVLSYTYSSGNFIEIAEAGDRNGLYEVTSHSAGLLTIRGVGTVAKDSVYGKDNWDSGTSNAVINRVQLSILKIEDGSVYVSKASAAHIVNFSKLPNHSEIYSWVTGWLEGGQITVNSGDDTKVDISAGSVLIVTGTNIPSLKIISWSAQTAIDPALVTRTKWVAVKDNGSGEAEFVFDTRFDSIERRTHAIIGKIRSNTVDSHLTNIDDFERPAWGLLTAFQDFILEFGSINLEGHEVSATASMQINIAEGRSYRYNAEDAVGRENVHTDPAFTPRTSYAYAIDGSGTPTSRSTLDPDYYSLSGVKTELAVGKYSRQELRIFPVSGSVYVIYGKEEYGNLADAEDAGSSQITGQLTKDLLDGSFPAGSIIMRKGINNLSAAITGGTAKILPPSLGDAGAGGSFGVDRDNIIYVGKHGNDGNDGLTPDKAKLTFGAAITYVSTQTPSATNRFTIYSDDAGNYVENVNVPSWVGVIAIGARIDGNHIVADNSLFQAFRVVISSGTAVTKTVGTGAATVLIPRIVLSGSANGVTCSSGAITYNGNSLEIENGSGIINSSATGFIYSNVGFINITGTGNGISTSSSGQLRHMGVAIIDDGSGTALRASNTGALTVNVSTINCNIAYNVVDTGANLNLTCALFAGTRLSSGSARYISANNGVDITGIANKLPIPNTAPADADLANSQHTIYVDETSNTPHLKFKNSSGVVYDRMLDDGSGGSTIIAYWDGRDDPSSAGSGFNQAAMAGNASYDAVNDLVELTPNTTGQNGTLTWALKQGAGFKAIAEFRISSATGADAMYFYTHSTSIPTSEDATNGGYIIALDEYQGDLQLRYNGTLLTNVTGEEWADNNWHRLEVIINYNMITVAVDGISKIIYQDVNGRNLDGQYLGFGSRTGDIANKHDVRRLELYKSNSDGMFISADGTEIYTPKDLKAKSIDTSIINNSITDQILIDEKVNIKTPSSPHSDYLRITGNTADAVVLGIDQVGTNNYCGISFKRDNSEHFFTGLTDTLDKFVIRNALGNYFVVQADGNVGIKTDNPKSDLHINGRATFYDGTTTGIMANAYFNGTDKQLTTGYAGRIEFIGSDGKWRFQNRATTATADTAIAYVDRIVINPNGNIGIGIDAPTQKLHVHSEIIDSPVIVSENSHATGAVSAHTIARTIGGDANVFSWSDAMAGTLMGQTGAGSVGILAENNPQRMLVGTFNNVPLHLGTNNTTRMTILNSGKIGIGTDTPKSKLTIESSDNMLCNIRGTGAEIILTDSYLDDAGLVFHSGEESGVGVKSVIVATGRASGNWSSSLGFYTQADGSSDPTEAMCITKDSKIGIGISVIPKGSIGSAKLAIEGTDSSSTDGPNIQLTTSADNYPLLQILPFSHDNISINFDAYYDGVWKSSDIGSNFTIVKIADNLDFNYGNSITAGSTVTWENAIRINSNGLTLSNSINCNMENDATGSIAIGEVLTFSSSEDNHVRRTTTVADERVLGVAVTAASTNSSVVMACGGTFDVIINNTVTRGDFLRSSAVAGRAESSGTGGVTGDFAVAMSSGTVGQTIKARFKKCEVY